jgi:large subunit ribosomal protein L13
VIYVDAVINGEGTVLGRLSSKVAKMLLNGERVSIVNAEKILISGHVPDIVAKYKRRIELRDKSNPEHSPYYSRRPDLFVKRVVRGMLPYSKPKGKAAYKRLKVYAGIPVELKGKEIKAAGVRDANEVYENLITIKKVSELLGYGRS